MKKLDNVIVSSNFEDNSNFFKLSANSLFNFMKQYEYLEYAIEHMAFQPRYYPENIEYLNLNQRGIALLEWYIPMSCFCDIPLHQIAVHTEAYGKFGIGLNKNFGIKKGIQPIQYLNNKSVQVQELSKLVNSLLESASDELENNAAADYIIDYLTYVKPITGKMKKSATSDDEIKKNFHDEHEWRYVPILETGELPSMLVDEDEIMAEKTSNIYSNSITQSKKGMLNFDVDDIRYIFVDNITNRDRLIKFIRSKKSGKRISKTDKDVLISKIIVYSELAEDW
ncbi:abortive infection system antitoxin AbiGi family protein [Latilactobacillus curvatus]|uniref:abortive phage resistance protein AbiGI n=1 Tax=Latilactobacillus curvatus TaxID=28038 RepID=UPI0020C79AF6|nr:abortive phage resistance protein AbiGI [Latilactobacillus curvatus]MCP8858763.1 abortive phage resistance protein [Latilactobacillus curvatus]UTC07399.1 abortive phage resistance protein [Latilactobacillus curvatus]WHQ77560.1 abortive infection system antitoxin AbiGi family protein [Latilactobacillus curvatus]